MKFIDRIDRKPVAVAFGLRRSGGGTDGGTSGTAGGDSTLTVLRQAESVSLVTAAGTASLPAATSSVAGVLGATDKAKLDSIEAGATAEKSGPEMVAAIDAHLGTSIWREGGGGGGSVATNLSVTYEPASVTVASDSGTDAVLMKATAAEAGVMAAADKAKLDGIEEGATADQSGPEMVAAIDAHLGSSIWREGGGGGGSVATNLSVAYDAASVTIASDSGTDAVLLNASAAEAGVMAAADKAKLDGIEPGAQANPDAAAIKAAYEGHADTNAFTDAEKAKLAGVEPAATGDQTGDEIVAAIDATLGGNAWQAGGTGGNAGTNLAVTRSANALTVSSDTGTDAVLLAASATEAGIMSAADKAKLDELGSGGQSAGDMAAAVYDPRGLAGDAFDRANHTGQQALDTVTGLQGALDGKAAASHGHAAGAITSGTLVHERGGLEADVSAYNGLVKISNGTTTQAVPGTDYAAVAHTHAQAQVTGLTTADSPQFSAINLGHATDTTLARSGAGQVTIEGAQVLTASNTVTVTNKSIDAAQLTGTVPVSRFNGGTGASASTYLRGDGTWAAPAGGGTGNVSKVGTPAANRMAYWTGDGTIGHEAEFTYDPTTDMLSVGKLTVGGIVFDGQNQLNDPNANRLLGWDDATGMSGWFVADNGLEFAGTSIQMTANQRTTAVEFVIDGGGAAIAPGMKGCIQVPFACTITAARLLADQSGSIVVDVWKDTYANYPPTAADTITASAKPAISSATKGENTALTGWTTAISAGDILGFNVDSASTLTRVTVILVVRVS